MRTRRNACTMVKAPRTRALESTYAEADRPVARSRSRIGRSFTISLMELEAPRYVAARMRAMRTLPRGRVGVGVGLRQRAVAQHGQHQQAEDGRLQEQQQGIAPVAGDDGQVTADERDELVPPARVRRRRNRAPPPPSARAVGPRAGRARTAGSRATSANVSFASPGSPRSRCWNTSAYCSRPKNCRVDLAGPK